MRSITGIKTYLTTYTAFEQEHETLAFPATIVMDKDGEPAIATDDEASIQSQELNQPSNREEQEQIIDAKDNDLTQMREKPIEVTFEEYTDVREEYPVYASDRGELKGTN
jgi:hypothetical protein